MELLRSGLAVLAVAEAGAAAVEAAAAAVGSAEEVAAEGEAELHQ